MRRLLGAFVVLLAIAAAGAWLAFHYVDLIVKYALEHFGPDVAGVSVQVGEVRISPRDGRGSLKGIEIGNPAGFSAARAARLGEVRVALDTASITEPVIRIHSLAIEAAQLTYERGAKGANLDVIQRHIDAYVQRAAADAPPRQEASVMRKRRFVIDRLTIRGARVLLTNPALRGQGLTFDLPDTELRDVGKRQGGVTASEAAAIVTRELQLRVARKLLTNLDALRRGGVEGAIDALKGLAR